MNEAVASAGMQGTYASSGLALLISMITSSINMSSPVMLWLMLCQFRNFTLLALLYTYLPDGIMEYILGLKVFNLSFGFLEAEKNFATRDFIEWISFDQDDSRLVRLEMMNGSSFVNSFNVYFVILLIVLINIV